MSGSEALIGFGEICTDPAVLEELLPHQSLFWDWRFSGIPRATLGPHARPKTAKGSSGFQPIGLNA